MIILPRHCSIRLLANFYASVTQAGPKQLKLEIQWNFLKKHIYNVQLAKGSIMQKPDQPIKDLKLTLRGYPSVGTVCVEESFHPCISCEIAQIPVQKRQIWIATQNVRRN